MSNEQHSKDVVGIKAEYYPRIQRLCRSRKITKSKLLEEIVTAWLETPGRREWREKWEADPFLQGYNPLPDDNEDYLTTCTNKALDWYFKQAQTQT